MLTFYPLSPDRPRKRTQASVLSHYIQYDVVDPHPMRPTFACCKLPAALPADVERLYLASFIRAEIGRNFRLGLAETFDRILSVGGGKLLQHDRRVDIQAVYVE